MKHLAIFASGTGSNAKKIIEYFEGHAQINVALVLSNNAQAGVLQIAENYGIPTALANKKQILDEVYMREICARFQIDFIALAGFMIQIPSYLAALFPHKMLNIHPALLPKYGGKGMYGGYVHEAVFAAHEKESGISIHFVNAHYDEGEIVFQEKVNIEDCNDAKEIAQKVLGLEHANYARIIEQVMLKNT